MTAAKTGDRRFEGTLIRTSGPSYLTARFLPSAVGTSAVGTASLQFESLDHALFTYQVDGVVASKPINRQVFGALPVCAFGRLQNLALASNYQDLWWAAPAGAEAGWGVTLAHQGDTIFATWFTHDTDGSPLWLSAATPRLANGVYSGTLYRSTGPAFGAEPFDPAGAVETPVGTLRLQFSDGNRATFEAAVGGTVVAKTITRQVFVQEGAAWSRRESTSGEDGMPMEAGGSA